MKFKVVIISLVLFLFACENDGQIWMNITPIQCLGNPWEQAWLEANDHDYDLWSALSDDEELDVFEDYYEDQGIIFYDIQVSWVYGSVCAACSCPRGDVISVLVDQEDVDFLTDLGFVVE